jgi:hypothetical protein
VQHTAGFNFSLQQDNKQKNKPTITPEQRLKDTFGVSGEPDNIKR